MADLMYTGGYQWAENARFRGDAGRIAAKLAGRHFEQVKDLWRHGDVDLREAMGDDEAVLDQGLDYLLHKMRAGLTHEVVNVRTEETMPGPRAFIARPDRPCEFVTVEVRGGAPVVLSAYHRRKPDDAPAPAPVQVEVLPAPAPAPVQVEVLPALPAPTPAPVVEVAQTVIDVPAVVVLTERQIKMRDTLRRIADAVEGDAYFAGVVAKIRALP